MKGSLYVLTIVLFLCSAMGIALAIDKTDSFPGRRITLGIGGSGNSICAFGDSIFGFDAGGPSGDTQLLGVEFDGTNFFVTGGNSATDPNKVYLFDAAGSYVSSFDQFRSTGWGWRDLAWDGDTLYGGDDDGQITKFGIDGSDYGDFPSPVTPARALAYDPATDHFYTTSWTANIYEIDRSGAVIGSWAQAPASYSVYGMAWDDVSPGGPWLWIFHQDPYPAATIAQWDPVNHIYTGVTLDVTTNSSIAGGACVTTEWDPSLAIIFTLHQADPDVVIGFELAAAAGRDVHPETIDSPGALVMPGVPVAPMATVWNTGDSTETFYTLFLVDSGGVNVYTDSVEVMTLMPDSVVQISFPDWTPDGQGNVYDLTCITNSSTDEARGNDTLTATTMAFLVDSIIECGWAHFPPSIDGIISVSEWGDADVVDISDILMEGSAGVIPGSVILYAMNNATHLFYAVDYIEDGSEDVNDRVTVYLDENNDDAWAPDSSEGNYWAFRSSGGPRLMYRPLPAGPFTEPVPGAEIGMASLINVTYEFSIPLGTAKYELDVALGDTMGMHIYAHDQGVGEAQGWWLQTMDAANQSTPSFYGHIVLHLLDAVEEREAGRAGGVFGLVGSSPSPFSATTRVSFATAARGQVSLEVCDASGRVVKKLVDGTREPGVHSVTWDGRDEAGKELPSGVYFYSLSCGAKVSSLKTVLIR